MAAILGDCVLVSGCLATFKAVLKMISLSLSAWGSLSLLGLESGLSGILASDGTCL